MGRFEIHCGRFKIVSELSVFGRRRERTCAGGFRISSCVLLAGICQHSQQVMNYASCRREEQVLLSAVMKRAARADNLLSWKILTPAESKRLFQEHFSAAKKRQDGSFRSSLTQVFWLLLPLLHHREGLDQSFSLPLFNRLQTSNSMFRTRTGRHGPTSLQLFRPSVTLRAR